MTVEQLWCYDTWLLAEQAEPCGVKELLQHRTSVLHTKHTTAGGELYIGALSVLSRFLNYLSACTESDCQPTGGYFARIKKTRRAPEADVECRRN